MRKTLASHFVSETILHGENPHVLANSGPSDMTDAPKSASTPNTSQPQGSLWKELASLWWVLILLVSAISIVIGFQNMLVFILEAFLGLCFLFGLIVVFLRSQNIYKTLRDGGEDSSRDGRFKSVRFDGIIASAALLVSIGCWFLLPVVWGGSSETVDNFKDRPSLSADQLQLASQTVHGYWKEGDDGLRFGDDEFRWTGTAGVIRVNDDHLVLVSNSHCLSLTELLFADDSDPSLDAPEILEYEILVEFASGVKRKVLQCGDQHGKMDLALLKVDCTGLSEGTDYVLLPIGDTAQIKPGDEVVAVGSPFGLQGTQTYGRISAVRDPPHGEGDVGFNHDRIFQTDAAINPGNSGGPLFVLGSPDTYKWIGINTWGLDGNNLGFAIDAKSVIDSSYDWFDADAGGVIAHLNALYDF